MNPRPVKLAFGTIPADWADELCRLDEQQQPEARCLLFGQHLQNYIQQMCYHQQQKQPDYHQHQQINYPQQEQRMKYHHLQEQTYHQQVQPKINYHTQERSYQEQQRNCQRQLLPTQLQPGQQQQLNPTPVKLAFGTIPVEWWVDEQQRYFYQQQPKVTYVLSHMNPTPVKLAFGTIPANWADEQQHVFSQQQPKATYLLSGQDLQNYNQQMCYHQQQKQLDYHQHHYQEQQRSYQTRLLPTQLQPGQQQQSNYQFHGQQPMLRHDKQYTQDEVRTLWVGGLQHWMNESYLYHFFSQTFTVSSISLIWNKCFGSSERYCYVEFASQTEAEGALNIYTSLVKPYTGCQPFKLHWASSINRKDIFQSKASAEYPTGEGNLAPECVVEHPELQEQPQECPKYSLWEGDLAFGFITEPGLLQDNP